MRNILNKSVFYTLKFFLLLLVFFSAINLYSFSLDIEGNNIIWSPVSDVLFIYSVYGKSSGKTIWKIYDIETKKDETIYFGDSLLPQWSFDGNNILFTKLNTIVINSRGKIREYKTAVEDLRSMDISLKGDRITYSDAEKIYILDIKNNNNYFVTSGESPLFMDNDKKILFFDNDLKVNIVDESLKSRVILPAGIKRIYPLKNQNKFLYQAEDNLMFYDLDLDIKYSIVEEMKEITAFNVSYDSEFLTYNNSAGENYVIHIPTRMKVKMLEDAGYFSQKSSWNSKYCAFEKEGLIHIQDIGSFINVFNLKNIYKVSFGASDSISAGMMLEVYQEKKNPFTDKLIGYEEKKFKGVLKVITVYKDYSYGMLEKDLSTDKSIEIGDAVLWKDENKLGVILEK